MGKFNGQNQGQDRRPGTCHPGGSGGQTGTVKHFTALPYTDVPSFIKKMRSADCDPMIRLALEFLILTAARSGEVRGTPPAEFDLDAKVWTIPAQRMKAEREHVVPLSERTESMPMRDVRVIVR